MTNPVIILMSLGTADPDVDKALGCLNMLCKGHLTRSFWTVLAEDVSSSFPEATFYTKHGEKKVELYDSIAEIEDPTCIRFVVLAASEDEEALRLLRSSVNLCIERLKSLAPVSIPFVDVRVIAPSSIETPSRLVGLFDSHSNANIVLIPEDRGSANQFARPLRAGSEDFGEHIAYEAATHVGLWSFMEDPWVDRETPGVIDGGDIKVVLSKSIIKLAELPSLLVDSPITVGADYPVPEGMEPVADPKATALRLADRLFSEIEGLQFAPLENYDPEREKLGFRSTLGRIASEFFSYLGHLPKNIVIGQISDLKHVSAAALGHALGEDRTIEVVFAGQLRDHQQDLDLRDFDDLEEELDAVTSALDQNAWSTITDEVLAAVDGGETNRAERLVTRGSRPAVIVQPDAICPMPKNGVLETSAFLVDGVEHLEISNTVIGRLAKNLMEQLGRANWSVAEARLRYESLVDEIRAKLRIPVGRRAHFFFGILIACLFLTATIPGGLAERLGMDTWSQSARTRVGGIAVVIAVGLFASALAASIESKKQKFRDEKDLHSRDGQDNSTNKGREATDDPTEAESDSSGSTQSQGNSKPTWLGFVGIVVVGLVGWVRLRGVLWNVGPFEKVRIGDLAVVLAVCSGGLYVIVYSTAVADRVVGSASRRLALNALIAFATFSTVLGTVDARGWYDLQVFSTGDTAKLLIYEFILLVIGVLVVAVIRVRHALQFDAARRQLVWLRKIGSHGLAETSRLETAVVQFQGTAAALSRVVSYPLGRQGNSESFNELEIGPLSLNKFQITNYGFAPESLPLIRARVSRIFAQPGWLRRQYSAAVTEFCRELAFLRGGSPSNYRPEQDASTTKIGIGIRWEFAERLYGGHFDLLLRETAAEALDEEALDVLMEMPEFLVSSGVKLNEFLNGAVRGRSSALPIGMFSRLPLPSAGDENFQFKTITWLPPGVHIDPGSQSNETLASQRISLAGGSGIAVIRTDLSQAFPLKRLPLFVDSTFTEETFRPLADDEQEM